MADGPFTETIGELRFPEWIEMAGAMPATEPIIQFWAWVGRNALMEAVDG
jgi:hypothetical protein